MCVAVHTQRAKMAAAGEILANADVKLDRLIAWLDDGVACGGLMESAHESLFDLRALRDELKAAALEIACVRTSPKKKRKPSPTPAQNAPAPTPAAPANDAQADALTPRRRVAGKMAAANDDTPMLPLEAPRQPQRKRSRKRAA